MIKLTQTVQKGGCAAKVAASELRKILSEVKFPSRPPELLVDGSLFDDAAIYRVAPDLALVQTLDFFTPIVDSPRVFGAVATANALSDVYAMGGTPKTAMAILAFPLASLESEVIVEVLQGSCDLLRQAQVALVGGHSIDDETLKFGLSVTGHVHPERIWSNAGARPGDKLILTKALGTGTLAAGLKHGAFDESGLADALASMMQLNNVPEILGDLGAQVHAATDITGFGLAGHAMQMALASRACFTLRFSELPVFPGAWESLRAGFLTKAHRSNADYTRAEFASVLPAEKDLICFDPQTSGGLLLSVAPEAADSVLRQLRPVFGRAALVGEVLQAGERALVLES
ncbi:MAG: selenide, water dikinase SelD [Bdellovibrionales bacterium]